MSAELAAAAILFVLAGGLAGFTLPARSRAAGWVSVGLIAAGAAAGIAAGLLALAGEGGELRVAWALPPGALHLVLDPLAGAFLLPLFIVAPAVAFYGQGYATSPHHRRAQRGFLGVMIAGIALLVAAGDAVTFLAGWEGMALSAFFLVGSEHEKESVRDAAMVYLIATHCGTLMLFGFFALASQVTGTYAWAPIDMAGVSAAKGAALLLLALGGFGLKAGIMPLHFWLPGAHASAPTHVSALMSGVLIKTGVYGLLRVGLLVTHAPVWFGGAVLTLGIVSGIAGVLFALAQHDLKRLLAYHSVENIGIIWVGAGMALLGRALGHPAWEALGLAGAILHVWNHGLFKSLLFLGAGSVMKATGTREIDRLGGLARAMPWTAAMFLAGSVAICGLPPLNGFVSEYLIMLGSLRALDATSLVGYLVMLATPAVAMMGALAALCFIKVYGAVFLGSPRTAAAAHGEAPWSMRAPMLVLSAACAAIGLMPGAAYELLRAVLRPEASASADAFVAPGLAGLGVAAPALAGGVALVWLWRRRQTLRAPAPVAPTWGCGYAAPSPRMQYTASSFAASAVAVFRRLLRPHAHRPATAALFPAAERFDSHVGEPVLDGLLRPGGVLAVRGISRAHVLQHGRVQYYLAYIFVMLITVFLIWL